MIVINLHNNDVLFRICFDTTYQHGVFISPKLPHLQLYELNQYFKYSIMEYSILVY